MALSFGAFAAALVVIGWFLSRLDGIPRVLGLFLLAYGVGMVAAAAFAARGHNPLRKRR
jgi:hypothetical protein